MAFKKTPKHTRHVMLDLETLGLAPNSAVIQAGLIHDAGAIEISVAPRLYDGMGDIFTVSNATIAFHHKKNPSNYRKCFDSEVTLVQMARDIVQFLQNAKHGAPGGGTYNLWIWCCGTDFDIPILKNFLDFCGASLGVHYHQVRDYRTLRELYKSEIPVVTSNDHSALSDAMNQYRHLQEILMHIGKWDIMS